MVEETTVVVVGSKEKPTPPAAAPATVVPPIGRETLGMKCCSPAAIVLVRGYSSWWSIFPFACSARTCSIYAVRV